MAWQNSFFGVGSIVILGFEIQHPKEVGEEGLKENPNQGHFDID